MPRPLLGAKTGSNQAKPSTVRPDNRVELKKKKVSQKSVHDDTVHIFYRNNIQTLHLTHLLWDAREVRWFPSARKLVHEDLDGVQVGGLESSKVSLDGMFKLRPCWRIARLFTHPV